MEETTSGLPARRYQIDLYEKAVDNNIIVYLPTGAGKTYIAILLLKKLSGEIQRYTSIHTMKKFFSSNVFFLSTGCLLVPLIVLIICICIDFIYLVVSKISFIFRPYSKNGKRSVFIANTVVLVKQQTEYIKRHTCLTCKGYSGDMKVDFWSREQWMNELEENQVLDL